MQTLCTYLNIFAHLCLWLYIAADNGEISKCNKDCSGQFLLLYFINVNM